MYVYMYTCMHACIKHSQCYINHIENKKQFYISEEKYFYDIAVFLNTAKISQLILSYYVPTSAV